MKIGIDIVSVDRIRTAFNKFGTRFTDQFLTEHEKKLKLTPEYIAKCWAVKEASIKASGIINAKQFAYGKDKLQPVVITDLPGNFNLSVTDEKEFAIAVVVRT